MLGLALNLENVAVIKPHGAPFNPLSVTTDAYWPLTTNLNDTSGGGKNMSASGAGVTVSGGTANFHGNDGLISALNSPGTGRSIYCIVNPTLASDQNGMLFISSSFNFCGYFLSDAGVADGNLPHTGSGSPDYYVNNVQITKSGAGGTAYTRKDLYDALSAAAGRCVLNIRGIDMSAAWGAFGVSSANVDVYAPADRYTGTMDHLWLGPTPADTAAFAAGFASFI